MEVREKIQAIQKVRAATGCLLLEAKKDVEEFVAVDPTATWEQAADAIISSHIRLLAVDAECARIREERAKEAERVTRGYTVEELRAMPDGALSRLTKDRDEWERRARELESLCADRL